MEKTANYNFLENAFLLQNPPPHTTINIKKLHLIWLITFAVSCWFFRSFFCLLLPFSSPRKYIKAIVLKWKAFFLLFLHIYPRISWKRKSIPFANKLARVQIFQALMKRFFVVLMLCQANEDYIVNVFFRSWWKIFHAS